MVTLCWYGVLGCLLFAYARLLLHAVIVLAEYVIGAYILLTRKEKK